MKRMILFSILVLFLVACDTSTTQGPHTWIDRPLNGDQFQIEPVTLQARQPIR
jgi:hypothetical protein